MSEKFDFSKIEDQKKFEELKPEEKHGAIEHAHGHALAIEETMAKMPIWMREGLSKYKDAGNKKSNEAINTVELKQTPEELTEINVSIEKLIPNIKARPKQEISNSDRESGREGYDFETEFAQDLPRFIGDNFERDGACQKKERIIKHGLRDQIIVDLGAGNKFGYLASIAGRAKGYIGVDKFYEQSFNKQEIKEEIKSKYPNFQKNPLVPAAWEKDDMLEFLKRLPDDSVSIFCSGLGREVFSKAQSGYLGKVEQEIKRVLHPKGFCVNNASSAIYLNSKEFECIKRLDGHAFAYVKKTKEREEELKKIEKETAPFEEIVAKIDNMDDLRILYQYLLFTGGENSDEKSFLNKKREELEERGKDDKK